MLFKLLLDIQDVATKGARSINTLPGLDLKLSVLPISDDFVSELFLKSELFISGFSDLLDFFSELEKGALEKLLESKGL
jgi:hypothetical protein